MFKHVCPRTGHVRTFKNGRAAKRWLREQETNYVPTLADDLRDMARTERKLGVSSRQLTRNRKGNVALGGVRGRSKTWAQPAKIEHVETPHEPLHRESVRLMVKRETATQAKAARELDRMR